jgi:hypothetical protein
LLEERAFSDSKIRIINVSLSKKIIDILNNNYSTKLKFFKDKYKFKINLVQNSEFLSQEFLFSFFDSKKKLISEFNGTEVKEPSSKDIIENSTEQVVTNNSENNEQDSDEKQNNYKVGKKNSSIKIDLRIKKNLKKRNQK